MLVFRIPLKSRQDLQANPALDDKDGHLLGADSTALAARTVKEQQPLYGSVRFNILVFAERDLIRP